MSALVIWAGLLVAFAAVFWIGDLLAELATVSLLLLAVGKVIAWSI